jgi:hypothetical protein
MIIVDSFGKLVIAMYMSLINVTTYDPSMMTIQQTIDAIYKIESSCSLYLTVNNTHDMNCSKYLADAGSALFKIRDKLSEDAQHVVNIAIIVVNEYLNDAIKVQKENSPITKPHIKTNGFLGDLPTAFDAVKQHANSIMGVEESQPQQPISQLSEFAQTQINYIEFWVDMCNTLTLDSDTVECSNGIFNAKFLLSSSADVTNPEVGNAINKANEYERSAAKQYYRYQNYGMR